MKMFTHLKVCCVIYERVIRIFRCLYFQSVLIFVMSSEAASIDEAIGPISDKKAAKLAKKEKFLAKQAKQQQQKIADSSAGKQSKSNAKGDGQAVDGTAPLTYTGDTPPGSFKNLDVFPDSYSPRFVEAAWYSWWEKSGFFKPEFKVGIRPSYCKR